MQKFIVGGNLLLLGLKLPTWRLSQRPIYISPFDFSQQHLKQYWMENKKILDIVAGLCNAAFL